MISGGRGGGPSVRYKRTDTCHSDQISRSARRDGATKNLCVLKLTAPEKAQNQFFSQEINNNYQHALSIIEWISIKKSLVRFTRLFVLQVNK